MQGPVLCAMHTDTAIIVIIITMTSLAIKKAWNMRGGGGWGGCEKRESVILYSLEGELSMVGNLPVYLIS